MDRIVDVKRIVVIRCKKFWLRISQPISEIWDKYCLLVMHPRKVQMLLRGVFCRCVNS